MIPKKQLSLKNENNLDVNSLILMLGILNGKMDELISIIAKIDENIAKPKNGKK